MDIKIEIKEEDPFSEDVASINKTEFFAKNITMKINCDSVLLDQNCDGTIKTEIKSETPFLDFCSQKEKECIAKPLIQQFESRTVTCNNYYEIDTKTGIDLKNDRRFLSEDSVMKVKKYNNDHKVDNKIEINEESCCLEAENSFVCYDIKDENFTSLKSPRLCIEVAPSNSCNIAPVFSTKTSGKSSSFNYAKDCLEYENQESDSKNVPHITKYVHSEQYGKHNFGKKIYSSALLIQKDKRSYKCAICNKSFTHLSHLKRHILMHEGKKPHKCDICEKSFTQLSHLKQHTFIHQDKKPLKCEICEKGFTRLSYLKSHYLMHEGKKPHRCELCEKSFTLLSSLKIHNLIHEGKNLHKCEICKKIFTQLSHLKRHYLIHEGKKPYKCEICEKNFIHMSSLKSHNLMHEGKKPHKCEICEKKYTQLSDLKRHLLMHEGKKPHKCEVCEKNFTQLSTLNRHNLIHEGKKPHKCEICEHSFNQLSSLKRHKMIHEGKRA